MDPSAGTPAPASAGRRALFRRLLQGLAALWAVGAVGAVLSYLHRPAGSTGAGRGSVEAGPADQLGPGQGRLVTGNHEPFWVVRARNGQLVALPATCTHRRCILEWQQANQVLSCPCHAGAFDLNGNVLTGPPPRPLVPLTVTERGGMVHVYV